MKILQLKSVNNEPKNTQIKILYFTNIFPRYREELWRQLISLKKVDFRIFFSKKEFNEIRAVNINKSFTSSEKIKIGYIKNFNFNGHLVWQKKVLSKLIFSKYNAVIFLGDMKIISNWVGILICKLKKKKVAFWTHGLYGNERGIKKRLRLKFLRLADNIFLYENRSKQMLMKNNFEEDKLHVVFNSINLRAQTKIYNALNLKRKNKKKYYQLVFIGRLTKLKKIDLAIKAVINLNRNTEKFKLTVVGDGPEYKSLKNIVSNANAKTYITFEKATYDEKKIGELFMKSDLLISPGNVGLNAVHAICYGTPVLTHNNSNFQMPESEVIIEGFNGLLHQQNNLDSIQQKIECWFANFFHTWDRDQIRKKLIKNYNPVVQAQIFESVLEKQ